MRKQHVEGSSQAWREDGFDTDGPGSSSRGGYPLGIP